MGWEIKVWHEDFGENTRLTIEAGNAVPDDVVSAVAGSYWFEEVQYGGEEWEGDEPYDDGDQNPTSRLQG